MINDYKEAKRIGELAVRKAIKEGVSPYLPVLDSFDEVQHVSRQSHLGLMELPVDRIKGNKAISRNNAFANNFMPIFDEGSEFAMKWSSLYDSYVQEGIRDAITVYEYMHNFYVQEGNKRVSVSRYGKSEYILADVTRVIPDKNDTKEVQAYYEYMDFYNVTKNFYIVFTEPGSYEKLAQMLDQNLKDPWPERLRSELNAAYVTFEKQYKKIAKPEFEADISEAFLIYISLYPMRTLVTDSNDQIGRNIKKALGELLSGSNVDNILFLDKATGEGEKKPTGGLFSLFKSEKRYSAKSPLRVAFIYDSDPDESRWVDSHEAGRLYLDEMTDDDVVTKSYISGKSDEELAMTIDQVIKDKNDVIFTVSPGMMSQTLKEAIKYPDKKFLNCSIAQTSSSVRSYHGRLYEATFLMGILAADILLREGKGSRKIGYLVRNFGNMSMTNMNAFAVGVSMLYPECTISMKYCGSSGTYNYTDEWRKEGVDIYADFEYSSGSMNAKRAGLFRMTDDKPEFIGAPYYSWGRYYVQIVQSVLYGDWNTKELVNNHIAANYWFGLATGVVDIRVAELPYQTRKLLSFFKSGIINGSIDPFSGELRSQSKVIQEDVLRNKTTISVMSESLPMGRIATMDWMNDNIE